MAEWVVITGASSGIGQALAIGFVNSNYNVLAIGRNQVNLQKIKSSTKNGNLITMVADLSEDEDIDKISKNIFLEDGVKYLIHCAAINEPHKPLTEISRIELKKIMDVNVMAPIFLNQKLAMYFDDMTRILFIGSDYDGVGEKKKFRPRISGAYGISKAALRVAVEHFRHESDNALIGYLNPGSTDTPMYKSMMSAVLKQQGVFGNTGQPADPNIVAKFIQGVLEATSDQDYHGIDWDFRDITHHQKIYMPKEVTHKKSKL